MTETAVLLTTGLISVAAIIASPIITLWIQRRLDDSKARRERRELIFKALWVNRRRQFYIARVDALNMIDVEFLAREKCRTHGKIFVLTTSDRTILD